MPDMHDQLEEERRVSRDKFFAEEIRVANDVEEYGDDVFVTFPNSDDPRGRERVDHYRPAVDSSGDPRLPQAGDFGCVIELDSGEIWLMY